MATSFISPFNRDSSDYNIWNSGPSRDDAVDTERYTLRAQDITEAAHSMRASRMMTDSSPSFSGQYFNSPLTGQPVRVIGETATNNPIAEIQNRLAQFEQYGQSELRRISDAGLSLNTRIDYLLSQIENQNAAILELSRIIDELKQDGLQPPEPLEDVD